MRKIEFDSILKVFGVEKSEGSMWRGNEQVVLHRFRDCALYFADGNYAVFLGYISRELNYSILSGYRNTGEVFFASDNEKDWNREKVVLPEDSSFLATEYDETQKFGTYVRRYYIYTRTALIDILSATESTFNDWDRFDFKLFVEEKKMLVRREILKSTLERLNGFVSKSRAIREKNEAMRSEAIDSLESKILLEILDLDDALNPFQSVNPIDINLDFLLRKAHLVIDGSDDETQMIFMDFLKPRISIKIKVCKSSILYTLMVSEGSKEWILSHDYYFDTPDTKSIYSLRINTEDTERFLSKKKISYFLNDGKINTDEKKFHPATEEEKKDILDKIERLKTIAQEAMKKSLREARQMQIEPVSKADQ